MSTKDLQEPVLVFGTLADIQYGDFEDGYNFHKTRKRYYRNSYKFQQQILEQWKNLNPQVEFILQLGDIIDGFNKTPGLSESSLKKTLDLFGDNKVFHVIGNHELYNFDRSTLLKTRLYSAALPACQSSPIPIQQGVTDQWYYTFLPHPSLRIIAMDQYEISVLGWPETSSNYQEAMSKYLGRNPNKDKNSSENMSPETSRLVKYNGGVGSHQLLWLEELLKHSDANLENVIVIGHIPIDADASSWSALCWNSEDILSLLHKYKCVISYWSGHDHVGGSTKDKHQIQHITFPAILETPPEEQPPIATVKLYQDSLYIQGQGILQDFKVHLAFPLKG